MKKQRGSPLSTLAACPQEPACSAFEAFSITASSTSTHIGEPATFLRQKDKNIFYLWEQK